MQTFLPYSNFKESAKCLDDKRLGKQRIECLQILKALTDKNYGWQNHPAVKMWNGCEHALASYGIAICDEWISRGFNDTCRSKIIEIGYGINPKNYPKWLGLESFHNSHKSNLLRKNPEHYRQFWPDFTDKLPYIWPN